MYGDGEPSENPVEPDRADHASTSASSSEALSKQVHDNPVFVGNATTSTSDDQLRSPDTRDGEPRATVAAEGPSFTPFQEEDWTERQEDTHVMKTEKHRIANQSIFSIALAKLYQNDGGWVPLMLSPLMFPGNPESLNGAPGTNPLGTFPFGTFPPPPGTTPSGTADGTAIPQWMPVLIPVQMPLFLPSPLYDQAGQNGSFYPVPSMAPFYGPFGMVPGAPAEFKFPVPMNVPMPTEGNLPGVTAGQQPVDAGRAPPVILREGVPLGQVGQMQPNGVPPVVQAGLGQIPDQRRVIRRFQVGIQLDLLLLLKLAVVVFVFNQDGSKDRLLILLGLAGVIYLYQTGSLAPLLRWLADKAQQFMTPTQQLAHPDGRPAPDAQAREAPAAAADAANPAAEEPAAAAEAAAEAPAGGANAPPPAANAQMPQDPFWAFVKEVRMLVVGFVTSLLPGFHPHAD